MAATTTAAAAATSDDATTSIVCEYVHNQSIECDCLFVYTFPSPSELCIALRALVADNFLYPIQRAWRQFLAEGGRLGDRASRTHTRTAQPYRAECMDEVGNTLTACGATPARGP